MHHLRRYSPVAALVAALIIAPASSFAFGLSGAGGKLGIVNPDGGDNTVTFGGHLEFEEPGSRWHLLPSVMYWSEGGVSDLNPNFDVYYHFDPEATVTPYLGAGVGLHMIDDNTDLGANLFGGLRIPMQASHLFVEGRYAATDVSHFGILGGVTFHLR